jgi:nitronate monooxygenase
MQKIPVIAAPMFLISEPKLVLAQCRAGVIGSFPSLNARPTSQLDDWLSQLNADLLTLRAQGEKPADYAVNLIVHKSNTRLEADLALCLKHKVPRVITSLGANSEVYAACRAAGIEVLHDVTTNAYAHKAIDKGATGLIAVCAGAGGHAGMQSPFALVREIREWFSGPLALSGAIATGEAILAAQVLGADYAYIGSAFIATEEAQASLAYKQAIIRGHAADIIYTNTFTGIPGNYLRESIEKAGLDPAHLPEPESMVDFAKVTNAKVWKDIWGSGQGIGAIREIMSVRAMVERWTHEYAVARHKLRL